MLYMLAKKIIITFSFLHIVFSQEINLIKDSSGDPVLSPVIKSLIVPGWGEYTLGYEKRAKIMALTESFIFISILGSYSNANRTEINYQAYAAQHAGVNIAGKIDNSGLILEIIYLLINLMKSICDGEILTRYMNKIMIGIGLGMMIVIENILRK